MDGDVAPLKDFIEIKKNYSNLYFVVDEAHALGTIGGRGAGLVDELGLEDKVFARVFTYGKSLGCHGAAVIGSQILVDYLVNFSRPLIYTTALPDSAVLRIRHSYSWLERGLNFSELQKNIGYFKSKTNGVLNFLDSDTPIQSLVCGSNDLANRIEMELRSKGFNVKGIKSPTVRIGSERIRFCIHSYNTKSQIDNLFEVLTEAVN